MAADFRASAILSNISVSPILALSRQAALLKRSGKDVIDMTVGEQDADTPDHIKAAATEAMHLGRTRYTALAGADDLVAAISRKTQRDLGIEAGTGRVIACAGAKQVIFNAFAATLDPGDEVVLQDPCWASYEDMVALAGGTAVHARGQWDPLLGWRLDAKALESAITPKTRWLLINTPSNPTGAVATKAELQDLVAVLQRHPQVWLLSDDIYEQIVFDGRQADHPLRLAPDLADRTLVVNGASKAYAMTGWRIGWGFGPEALIAAMVTVQSQITSAPSSISQCAARAAIDGAETSVIAMREHFSRRRRVLGEGLSKLPGVVAPMPQGAFYHFPSIEGLIGARTTSDAILATDHEIAAYLLDRASVAVVPGSAFGAPGWLRLSYAVSDAMIEAAVERIQHAIGILRRD